MNQLLSADSALGHDDTSASGQKDDQQWSTLELDLPFSDGSAYSSPEATKLCIPVTHDGCMHFHNMVAMPLMRQPGELRRAYSCFEEVNTLHSRIHGTPCVEAIYNQACCLSLAAAVFFANPHDDLTKLVLSSSLGGPCGAAELAEANLENAIATLHRAVGLGYSDVASALADDDLKTLRDRRPGQFQALMRRMQDNCARAGA